MVTRFRRLDLFSVELRPRCRRQSVAVRQKEKENADEEEVEEDLFEEETKDDEERIIMVVSGFNFNEDNVNTNTPIV